MNSLCILEKFGSMAIDTQGSQEGVGGQTADITPGAREKQISKFLLNVEGSRYPLHETTDTPLGYQLICLTYLETVSPDDIHFYFLLFLSCI